MEGELKMRVYIAYRNLKSYIDLNYGAGGNPVIMTKGLLRLRMAYIFVNLAGCIMLFPKRGLNGSLMK